MLCWIEQERDLSWFFLDIVVGWTWDIFLHERRDVSLCWVLGNIATFGDGRLREAVTENERLGFVLARAWNDLERLHRADWVTEPIVVVFDVDLATWNDIHSWLELLVLRLFNNIKQSVHLVSCHLWLLVLVRFGLSVRVV